MSSREKILEAVKRNQPPARPLPDMSVFGGRVQDTLQQYTDTFTGIGGKVLVADSLRGIETLIPTLFDTRLRIITTLPELSQYEQYSPTADPHTFEDVELAVLRAELAVSENGAVWLPEQLMGQRIIPFICQHLAVVVNAETIVPTMHEAYRKIGEGQYGFGAFIGGPSKTADIEQSLVMGAHGPISMTVFIVK